LTEARAKFRGAVASTDAGQIWKQRAFAGQVFEQIQRLAAQVNQHRHTGFHSGKTSGDESKAKGKEQSEMTPVQ
jgi:hypothetical protein